MKALEKDRTRRYETASGLARDIQRHLSDEPVEACPPSASYRLRKFAKKNRAALTTAAALAVLLLAGTAVSTWQAARATRAEAAANSATEAERLARADADKEKDHAIQSAAREADERRKADIARGQAQAKEAEANAVVKFFEDKVFSAGRPKGEAGGLGHGVSLRDAIKASLPALGTDFRDQPLVEARLRFTLGGTFYYLGDYASAAEQLDQARVLFARHRGPDYQDTLRSMSELARSYAKLNRQAEALALRREILAAVKRLVGPNHPDTLVCQTNLAASYYVLNQFDEALKLFKETLDSQQRVLPADDPAMLGTMDNVASCYAALNRYPEALKVYEEVLDARRRVLPPDHPDTLATMNNLARCYVAAGLHARAIKLFEDALAARTRVLGPDHPETLKSAGNLAYMYSVLMSRHAEAIERLKKVLDDQKRVLGADHPDTLRSMCHLAGAYVALNRHAEAVPLIDEVLAKTVQPGVDPWLIQSPIRLRLRCCQKFGDVAGCRASTEMWENQNAKDASTLYDAACYRAVTAALQAKSKEPDATRLATDDADKAMVWLTKAVAAGIKDVDHMKTDTDLDFLRDREDFQKLLAGLEKAKND
jgi:non-specific serine/threonine protein kinase/serine/threonine-protein kinase